ncbi:MAG TPA: polysaccharide deacetylase family protein [Anaerolineae bacterium]|nr:polysaccharide deacetylase family protein [Anaerolineae bacterium]
MTTSVPILLYHSVADTTAPRFKKWTLHPEFFAVHMQYLADQHYTPLTVTQWLQLLSDRRGALPERPIVISFDDGYTDFLVNAVPILQHYGFGATLYVVTKYVGQSSTWLQGQGAGDRSLLTWAQLAEVNAAGIECGAHSHTHVQLDTVPLAEAREEIARSKNELEQHLNRSVESFAYPYGYHNALVRELVQEAGFTSACAVKHALSTVDDDRFALSRIIISADTNVDRFAELLTGRHLRVAPMEEQVWTKGWRVIRRLRGKLTAPYDLTTSRTTLIRTILSRFI